jgi:hypothetical protein
VASDPEEKLRQAQEWLAGGTPDQKVAAVEHLSALIRQTADGDLRTRALAVFKQAAEASLEGAR